MLKAHIVYIRTICLPKIATLARNQRSTWLFFTRVSFRPACFVALFNNTHVQFKSKEFSWMLLYYLVDAGGWQRDGCNGRFKPHPSTYHLRLMTEKMNFLSWRRRQIYVTDKRVEIEISLMRSIIGLDRSAAGMCSCCHVGSWHSNSFSFTRHSGQFEVAQRLMRRISLYSAIGLATCVI